MTDYYSLDRLLRDLSAGHFDQAARDVAELEALGDVRGALLGQLVLATRWHDGEQVRAIAASPQAALLRQEPELHAMLARALYWTNGIEMAAAELQAVCASEGLPAEDKARREICALAELARLVSGKRLWEVEATGEGSVELLKEQALPIFLASVNGLPAQYFILDTGAPTSVLAKAYCDRVGIPYLAAHTHVTRDGAGNEVTLYPTLVDRVQVGGVAVRNWTANVIELPPNFRIGGILSPLDTFRNVSTELDMREWKFRIYAGLSIEDWVTQVDEPVHSTPLVWDDGNVFVRASANGRINGWFLFDTGAGANIVSPEVGQFLREARLPENAIKSATAGGTTLVFKGFDGELAVGDSAPIKSNFMIKDRRPDPDAIAPLISSGYIGIPWLLGRRLLLAPGGRQILFTEA
ncbi:MAG: aspartyl protease family protein [Acidobacteria bacterium]|nr:aspartyl protease family protein [Acidobacteriota bacterium]